VIIETDRLIVRKARERDAELYYALWTDPSVMQNVGFPRGLSVTTDSIRERLLNQPDSPFDRLLVVCLKNSAESIGECSLHFPDENGIARTDVKLLPRYWGKGFGVEIKRGLLDYLFRNTDCSTVEASPNVDNTASIRMQEAVGGVRTGESIYHFPEEMKDYTTPVHHYTYSVSRSVWEKLSLSLEGPPHTASGNPGPGGSI